MRTTEADTVDMDPDEIFSSSRIFNENDNFLDANDKSTFSRLSLAATPSALSVHTVYFAVTFILYATSQRFQWQ